MTRPGGALRTTLLELIALLRRARLVVAGDTGPLHLACAVGTPVVGIYGPTDPARNGPFAPADRVVRRAPACAPCHRRQCAVHDGVMFLPRLTPGGPRLSRFEWARVRMNKEWRTALAVPVVALLLFLRTLL